MARTGCTLSGQRLWSACELALLRDHYPDMARLHRALPGRTAGAIGRKAGQLGLVPPRRIWSGRDAQNLRKPYVAGLPMADLLAMFPDKTSRQIWHKASHLGIHRPRRPPKPTGFALLDQIRRRAHDLGLTMRDLDSYTGGKGYFAAPRRQNLRLLDRAIRVLQGRIHVEPPR